MNVVFMGSPDFAVPALRRLIEAPQYDVKLVVSQTDKPVGRKQVLTPPPVKEVALQNGIEVFQPKTLRTPEAAAVIAAAQPDFIVVAAYGKILPQAVLDIPRFGCVNLHGSLLPKYRGAAPIQWSVINGENETGVTTMLMDAGLDTGDILYTEKTPICANETAGELFDRLAGLCPALLMRTLEDLAAGKILPQKQDESESTYAPMLSKADAEIDWSLPAGRIHDLVRGLNPWPVAKTTLDGRSLKIWAGEPARGAVSGACGTVRAQNGELLVACGGGTAYRILSLQAEGAKRMSAADFLRGHAMDGAVLR